MAQTRFSAAALAQVNQVWDVLGEQGERRDRWKMVSLVLAEALFACAEEWFQEMVELEQMTGYSDALVMVRVNRLVHEVLWGEEAENGR